MAKNYNYIWIIKLNKNINFKESYSSVSKIISIDNETKFRKNKAIKYMEIGKELEE